MKSPNLQNSTGCTWAALAVIALVGTVYLYTAPVMETYGSDTTIYYETAKSILAGNGYQFNFQPQTIYPPGYPLLLAGAMRLAGDAFGNLIKIAILVSLLGLVGSYTLVQRLAGARRALIINIFLASSYIFYFWSTAGLHSDVPYFVATVLSILSFDAFNRSGPGFKNYAAYGMALFLFVLSAMLRSIGITMILALVIWMLNPLNGESDPHISRLRRIKIWGPSALIVLIVLGIWTNWSSSHKPATVSSDFMSSYASQLLKEDVHQVDSGQLTLAQLPSRMLTMLKVRAANAGKILLNLQYVMPKWTNPLILLPALFIITGWATALFRHGRLFDWYFATYLGVLLLWPFDEGGRFLFPVLPWVYFYLIEGGSFFYQLLHLPQAKWHLYVFAGLAVLMAALAAYSPLGQGSFSKQDMLSIMLWLVIGFAALVWIAARRFRDAKSVGRIVVLFETLKYKGAIVVLLAFPAVLGIYRISGTAHYYAAMSEPTCPIQGIAEASHWIADNAQAGDIIMTDEYAIVHRLTKRKTVLFPLTSDTEQILQAIKDTAVKYIIVPDPAEFEYFNPPTAYRFEKVSTQYSTLFTLIGRVKDCSIFQVLDKGSRTDI